MSKLILIRGLPGSGKSTLARAFTGAGYHHIEADMFHINPKNGKYEFDVENIHPSHAWCQSSTKKLLDEGRNVVVSNTFTLLEHMEPYLNMEHDVSIIIALGKYEDVHNVPTEVLANMAERWEN